MIVVLDSRSLVRWAATDADPHSHRARLEHLLETTGKERGRILLPTPVIAEFLVRADEVAATWLSTLERRANVVVASFDRKAALECALLDASAFTKGDKRGGRKDAWQRVKVDRQIVAIALSLRATLLVTDDAGMTTTAKGSGLAVMGLEALPLPDSARQRPLDLPNRT